MNGLIVSTRIGNSFEQIGLVSMYMTGYVMLTNRIYVVECRNFRRREFEKLFNILCRVGKKKNVDFC